MGFKILKKMHGAGGGGNRRAHHDDCNYSSSEEEDADSYDSFEDENYQEKDDREHNNDDADEENDDRSTSEYSSGDDDDDDDDDVTEVDPELLCPTCGVQTHEYVRRGTILRKWKRMPVEDETVVDVTNGDCVACKKERLDKMKSEWLDDIPTLPEGLFKKRADLKDNVDQHDADDDGKPAGALPIRTQGERYRHAIRNRRTSKKASFGSSSASSAATDNEEQVSQQFDEVSAGVGTFSCGVSINSEGRSIRTGPSKLDTLQEVPEREETSVEESEDSSEDDDGSDGTDEAEEELDEVEEEIGDQLAQLEQEVAACRGGAAKDGTFANGTSSHNTPSVATAGRFDDFLAEHEVSPFVDQNATEGPDPSTKCDQSVAGQNGATDGGENDASVADVSNVLEQYTSAKDQTSTKQRMAEMGRTFRGMVAGGLGSKKNRNTGEDEEEQEKINCDDAAHLVCMPATTQEVPAGGATPDWAAGLDEEKGDVSQVMSLNATAAKDPKDLYDQGETVTGDEKDPQLFYNEAVAAVAAATTTDAKNNSSEEAKKTKKKSFKSPFHRKLKSTKGDVAAEVAPEKGIAQQAKPEGDVSFGFPDLLPDEGAKEKKLKRFGINIGKSKKNDEPEAEQLGENPFLPEKIAPAQPTDVSKQQPTRKMISSMFPDTLLSAVPEDRPDDSPPPPVLEIATGPENDVEDAANPNTTDVDHLIRGLQSTVDDPRLARKFLISLRTMSIHHPNRLGIAEAGGIHAIVVCMRRFKRESAVAKQGCAALQNLVCADKNEQRSVEEGALDAIVRAMMNHSRSPGTQEHGAAALRNLTAGSLANRTAVAEAGGIEALVKAMKVHPRNVDVQDKCCAALANVCNKHRANRVAIGEAGSVPYVVQALRMHGYRSKSVAEKGVRCLLNLSHTARNVEIMKCEEGIEGLVLGVAHRHGGKCKEWALKIFLKM